MRRDEIMKIALVQMACYWGEVERNIAVMEKYRRKGIGNELITQAMSRGRKLYDCNEGYLEVRVSNESAIGLYSKLEFSKVKRNYGYYLDGEDAWVMAASLDSF